MTTTPAPPEPRRRPQPGPRKAAPIPELSPLERLAARSPELAALAAPITGPAYASAHSSRSVAIRSNLLPREVLAHRSLGRTKKRVRRGLLALVALIAAGYAASWWQTHTANIDLHDINAAIAAQQRQLDSYQPLVTAQDGISHIQAQLRTLMADDLQWSQFTGSVRGAAPSGVKITGLTASLTGESGSTSSLTSLNTTGKQPVGSLTITGTAPDKTRVGAYLAALAKIRGLATPYPASLSDQQGGYTFSLNALITSDALGGRYTTAAKAVN